MATGDQQDLVARLQALIPPGWFAVGQVPLRDAILSGFANCFAFVYALLAYVKLQTRISSSTDGWLDLTAYDFFGDSLARSPGQSDASFRNQIISTLFRKRNTVAAIKAAVYQLLGTIPIVLEPQNAASTGGYNEPTSMGYNVAGIWGDTRMPLQCFVQVEVPGSLSIAPPFIGGYGSPMWGYGVGQAEYATIPTLNPVLIADIYQAIVAVLPVCGVAWVSISVTTKGITTDTTRVTTDTTQITTDGGSI